MKTLKRSYLAVAVLQLLLEEQADGIYGYRIGQILNERSDSEFEIKYGSLYPVLHELEQNGFIEGVQRRSREGPQQRWFKITPAGEELLKREQKGLLPLFKLILGSRGNHV